LLLNHYNPAFGFREWAMMKNPDLFVLKLEGDSRKILISNYDK